MSVSVLIPTASAASPSSTATPVSPSSLSDTPPTTSTAPTSNSNTSTTGSSSASTTNASSNTITDGTSTIAPKRKASRRANTAERRATHNAVERQRRETLNGRFLDLAALLPNLATVRRPSKSAIVNSSIALIHSHRRARAAAGRELRVLEEETIALRREVNEWRARTALPALQAPQRSAEFMALIHAGEADDEGAAAEEERRAYLLAGQGGPDEDDEEWDQQNGPQQGQHNAHSAPSPVGPSPPVHMQYPGHGAPNMGGMGPGPMMNVDEKMAQWNALQYAMQMQAQGMNVNGMNMNGMNGMNMHGVPDPRMAMALQAQRDHPQWSATASPPAPSPNGSGVPTLFARPVPIPQHNNNSHFSGPFAFGVPPLNTNAGPTTFNTAGYLGNGASGSPHSSFVGSPTGSTPPATTSSSFEDGTESEGEHHHGMMGHGHAPQGKWMQTGRTGGPGGFAAMGMGVVI